MAKIQIEMDEEKANKPLTKREKMGLVLIYLLFKMVYPVKYNHQLDGLEEMLFDKN